MAGRISAALSQLSYLRRELAQMVNTRWWRWFTLWFNSGACVIVSYRLDRAGYLLIGGPWTVVRILLFPLFLLLRILSYAHEIHYRADVGPGLLILHPSLGVVVSGSAIVGKDLVLTGGNCIGARPGVRAGDLIIGDNVTLGANAVVLGPVRVGSNVTIGAGAVVIDDAGDNVVLGGVPARVLRRL
jgi:serine O-acetyltransferase